MSDIFAGTITGERLSLPDRSPEMQEMRLAFFTKGDAAFLDAHIWQITSRVS